MEDVGVGDGRHYSVNVPLQEGMDDESYRFMFEPIMQKVYFMLLLSQPGVVMNSLIVQLKLRLHVSFFCCLSFCTCRVFSFQVVVK